MSMRLDKFLADMHVGTRSEVKKLIKKGVITVDGTVIKNPEFKIEENASKVIFNGKQIKYLQYQYYMLNKPAGFITATKDDAEKTVMDLMDNKLKKELFPIGRLDKDTEGLLLITNDGALSHFLMSPKNHVEKTYYAVISGKADKEDQEEFKKGLAIGEKRLTLPSELTILTSAEESEILLTITEGKFHQVKRMFEAVGKKVIYLKRISVGTVFLDPDLPLGKYRKLTGEEIEGLKHTDKKEDMGLC